MIGMEELVKDIELGVLVHPTANKWYEFYLYLNSKVGSDVEIPVPLILGGSGANDFNKNKRLKSQLALASKSGPLIFNAALEFLATIAEEDWVKSEGDLDPEAPEYY